MDASLTGASIIRVLQRLCEECLNEQVFVSLDDARRKIETWRAQYHRQRPHSSLGYLTPEQFVGSITDHQSSSAAAGTAGPANQSLAVAVQAAAAPNQELITLSGPPSNRVEGEPEKLVSEECN